VGHIRVREDDFVYIKVLDQGLKLALRINGDALRIERARKGAGVLPALNVGNLRSRKRNNLETFIVAQGRIEIVEISAGRAGNNQA
jgi:hypothetical protein